MQFHVKRHLLDSKNGHIILLKMQRKVENLVKSGLAAEETMIQGCETDYRHVGVRIYLIMKRVHTYIVSTCFSSVHVHGLS